MSSQHPGVLPSLPERDPHPCAHTPLVRTSQMLLPRNKEAGKYNPGQLLPERVVHVEEKHESLVSLSHL